MHDEPQVLAEPGLNGGSGLPTASVLFSGITGTQILGILGTGIAATILSAVGVNIYEKSREITHVAGAIYDESMRSTWRMSPVSELAPAQISLLNRLWMIVRRAHLVVCSGYVDLQNVPIGHRSINGGFDS